MRALLGQSLFGDRDVSTSVGPEAGFAQLATAIRRRRAVFAGIAVVAVLGAASVVRAAITHRAGEDATKEVDTLAHLMETGSVEQVKAAIPRFEALAATAGAATAANRAALARGEATVYRYLGAEPERKAKVEALLAASDLTGDDAVLARALITGDEERGAMLEELRDFAARHPKDSEPVYLMACAHAALGEKRLATKEMKHAEELEPSHLPHLLGAVSFFAKGKHKDEALRIFEQMNDVQPNSPFTVDAMKLLAARGWL
jgi:cytochrome c-type biogenesis protein CcmH/NrfG